MLKYKILEFCTLLQNMYVKGQLISKCLYGVITIRLDKKANEIFSALASKERSNQKNKATLLY